MYIISEEAKKFLYSLKPEVLTISVENLPKMKGYKMEITEEEIIVKKGSRVLKIKGDPLKIKWVIKWVERDMVVFRPCFVNEMVETVPNTVKIGSFTYILLRDLGINRKEVNLPKGKIILDDNLMKSIEGEGRYYKVTSVDVF